ncbi:hypothetical protein BCR42DRAFT_489263 [Absidia repens]|uniref:Rhodanese domain-containing protein n=1 Tax=Absidia repens TaxID=90262 RepID=A0A1X2IR83_9FUNG|nr:hypothetical protein BCR42DRAFT_489263 [Absidia repens]
MMLKRLVVLRTSIQHAPITKRSLSFLSSTGGRARYEACHQQHHHQLVSKPPSSPCQAVTPKASRTTSLQTFRFYTITSSSVSPSTSTEDPLFRTLAFYKFHPLPASSLDQLRTTLLTDLGALGIVGRIYISTEGLNAQLSCPEQALTSLRDYCTRSVAPLLGGDLMDLNFGTQGDTPAFRALHVRIRKQLVADGLDPTSYDLTHRPSHLSPKDWHDKLQQYRTTHGKEPVLIDMRNHYESNIGYFDGAIRPDADTFKDSIDAMNDICKDLPRDQEVFMYCTGGIRCSKAGAILQSQSGFDTVHLVEGGITAYGRWIQEQDNLQSLFRGKNFTFDARMGETITDEITGTRCHVCGDPCNRYQNCAHAQCNLLMLCCSKCASQFLNTCARLHCYDTVHEFIQHHNTTTTTTTAAVTAAAKAKAAAKAAAPQPQRQYYDAAGPVMVDGVRAYVKEGHTLEESKRHDRVVVGTSGKACEHEYHRRTRALDVLGEPGQVLKEWANAGRQLPPAVAATPLPSSTQPSTKSSSS